MIDPQLAAFLQEGLSIHIGTRDDARRPAGARAAAATVDPGGQHLTVYVARVASERLRAALDASGQAAVGFGRPEDERACQVKGVVVEIRDARPDEEAIVARQWQGFLEQYEKIGINRGVAVAWAYWPATAIRIRVTAVFEQTPGPHAGAPIA